MDRRALQHPLKAGGGLGVLGVAGDEIAELVVDIGEDLAAQPVEIDAASAQNRDRVLVLGQREQQVLERGVFVTSLIGVGEGPMQRLFQIT